MKRGPKTHAVSSQPEVAKLLGMPLRTLQDTERRVMQVLRDELADVAEDYFLECRRNVCGGRWNGKRLVRVER